MSAPAPPAKTALITVTSGSGVSGWILARGLLPLAPVTPLDHGVFTEPSLEGEPLPG